METLQTLDSSPSLPAISISFSPLGPAFTYTVGGTAYSSPYQKEVFTNTDIQFTGNVVLPAGVTVLQYYWDFGDGAEAFGNPVHHTYTMPVSQTRVSFCVTDNYNRQVCVGQMLNLRAGIPVLVGAYIVKGS